MHRARTTDGLRAKTGNSSPLLPNSVVRVRALIGKWLDILALLEYRYTLEILWV